MSSLLLGDSGGFWFPRAGSTTAFHVDSLFNLIYWICVVFFVLIIVPMIYFMVKYRRQPGVEPQDSPHHNNALEITWSVIPSILIVVIFAKGFIGFLDMRTPPENTYDITVIAKKWNWAFMYPNGVVSPDLHVPADVPVKLLMQSDDVIHSFFVPVFRAKQDIVPGRISTAWFQATLPEGSESESYNLFCAEYCGQKHSDMIAKAVVHTEPCFEKWLQAEYEKKLNMPPVQLGELLYQERGCSGCHSLDGSKKIGPSFNQTYGNMHKFSNAPESKADEDYIRESIRNPMAKIREGYNGVMPVYSDSQLGSIELNGLILFIKSLNPEFAAEVAKENISPSEKKKQEAGESAEDAPTEEESGELSLDERYPLCGDDTISAELEDESETDSSSQTN
ncbi:cytochrome c oxidase subunit II [Calycomorphotria hydatis]|nr:cytochrome c oxidase subunit II [Calycomorphotria hydatis]